MKGLILAAGMGTRLRPITSLAPKPTISVANKPLIHYAVDNLVEVGISEVGIVVSPSTIGGLKKSLAEYEGASFTYIIQDPPKGLAHAVEVSQDFLQDDDFVMYLGDNLFEHGVKEVVDRFVSGTTDAVMALTQVDDPRAFGVAVVENDQITRLVEKPKDPPSNLAVAGVYVFSKKIHEQIEGLEPGAKNEYQITDAIQKLIEAGGTVKGGEVSGWWKDTGHPGDILDANRLLLLRIKGKHEGNIEGSTLVGEVIVEKGATLKNATVFGPVVIGPDAHVENAFVGPYTTLGKGVKVKDAELEYSVVGRNTEIENVASRIQASLIGADVKISGHKMRPATHTLTVGDKSVLELHE